MDRKRWSAERSSAWCNKHWSTSGYSFSSVRSRSHQDDARPPDRVYQHNIFGRVGRYARYQQGMRHPLMSWIFLLTAIYLGSIFIGMKLFRRLNDFGARLIALSLMLIFGVITVALG